MGRDGEGGKIELERRRGELRKDKKGRKRREEGGIKAGHANYLVQHTHTQFHCTYLIMVPPCNKCGRGNVGR